MMFVLLFPILPPQIQILNLNVWLKRRVILERECKSCFDFSNMTKWMGHPQMESITKWMGHGGSNFNSFCSYWTRIYIRSKVKLINNVMVREGLSNNIIYKLFLGNIIYKLWGLFSLSSHNKIRKKKNFEDCFH